MSVNSAKLLDLCERVGWTFVQALAATVYIAGQSADFAQIDWATALQGAGIAALLALLKYAGVNASTVVQSTVTAQAAAPRHELHE